MYISYFFQRRLLKALNNKIFGLFLFSCCITAAYASPSEGYQVATIEAEPYTQVIQRTGKVDFARVVNLSFKTAGFLTELNVDEGEVFKKNQLLAALDTSELLAEKNATYSRLLQAKRNIDRVKVLLEKNLSSQRDLDDALTAVETTRAAYKVASYNLNKAQILAPFDGVVIQRSTDLGELQAPGAGALQVATLSKNLIASVSLTGEEISLVHLNQEVKVNLAYAGLVNGRISKIPAIADSRNHLFTIEVSLEETNLTKPLIVGQIAKILIYAQSENYIYRLPIEALNSVNEQGQALITIEKDNAPVQQAFVIYKLDNDFIYLTAQENSPALDVITQGWNNFPLISTKK
ncbi:efflux RND transporter periplasmic adaptor subunit [Colwellia sp. 4_MG-2023]|uniref:efflux RND transporter periplasmic adaptor subunit n=1 Tax=unclassified Colwellia TaxID=196834 RepID=UPI0026E3B7BB|nr:MULTISPECIES: efflux RND transporter periplasmic adaptor subunit [unclassified Colwellia]MDO6506856.1 efflux RND transporter periplasmic adaptor subunit [Colwellia sp. 5_MG-2023]MDO6555769.1 efflux RND transporter periplasmic adaptor subunit [Colwellia sp. 4_MG-2023]